MHLHTIPDGMTPTPLRWATTTATASSKRTSRVGRVSMTATASADPATRRVRLLVATTRGVCSWIRGRWTATTELGTNGRPWLRPGVFCVERSRAQAAEMADPHGVLAWSFFLRAKETGRAARMLTGSRRSFFPIAKCPHCSDGVCWITCCSTSPSLGGGCPPGAKGQRLASSRFGYPTIAGSQTEHDRLFEGSPGGLEMVDHETESDQIAVGGYRRRRPHGNGRV